MIDDTLYLLRVLLFAIAIWNMHKGKLIGFALLMIPCTLLGVELATGGVAPWEYLFTSGNINDLHSALMGAAFGMLLPTMLFVIAASNNTEKSLKADKPKK